MGTAAIIVQLENAKRKLEQGKARFGGADSDIETASSFVSRALDGSESEQMEKTLGTLKSTLDQQRSHFDRAIAAIDQTIAKVKALG